MAAKKITIVGGYVIQFNQRAPGEETPFYVGTIYKDGEQVGTFSNGGRGGPTNIMPPAVSADFLRLVDETAEKLGTPIPDMTEREAIVIEYAEVLGYNKLVKNADPTKIFEMYVEQSVEQWIELTTAR